MASVSQQGPAAALPIQYLIQPINGPGLKIDKGAECHIKALHKINAITTVKKVVRVKGLEPPRHRRQNLNLVRLPIPPHPHCWLIIKQVRWWREVKTLEMDSF